jgi:DNA-directed RNA polymerase specialized sigma24 family protein
MMINDFFKIRHRLPGIVASDEVFEEAISHLPTVVRWVMILSEREGLSTQELADLAGVRFDVVEATQSQGLALIQKEFLMRARQSPA